jgi:hypothetical protein
MIVFDSPRIFYSKMWVSASANVRQFVLRTVTYPLLLVTPNPNFMHTIPVHRKVTSKAIKSRLQVRRTIRELSANGLVPLLPWRRHLSSAQNPIESRASYNTANYFPSFADCFHKLVLPSGSRGKQSVNDRHSCLHLNVQRRTVVHAH